MVWSWDAVHWNFVYLIGTYFCILLALSLWLAFGKSFKRNTLLPLLTVLLYGLFMGMYILNEARGPWEIQTEGIYNHATIYTTQGITSTGAGYTTYHTIVFFQDGQSYELHHVQGIPFPSGTNLRILKKNGFYKFEKY